MLGPLRGALALLLLALLSACQSFTPAPPESNDSSRALSLDSSPLEDNWLKFQNSQEPHYVDIWERIREGYKLQDQIAVNPRVERQRLWFANNTKHIQIVSERAAPYIHYIVERIDERNMPMELALLPVIESAYNAQAYSSAHAAGLWQFIPSTGRVFNLRQTSFYDGRRDVTASTRAALDYLGRLHHMFNGDWLLALAAYNAGEGRISRAIKRNEQLGLPTDYWNLNLPPETQDYVPKLLALSQVIQSPAAYGIDLAEIADEPYFEKIPVSINTDLAQVAEMADLEESDLLLLNPAHKHGVVIDGPRLLLVPSEKAEMLSANLSLLKPQEPLSWQRYTVRSGDNLHNIANRHHLTVPTLKEINRLSSNNLRVGQELMIPGKSQGPLDTPLHQRTPPASAPSQPTYVVKQGDNLWQIAKEQNISVAELRSFNQLRSDRLKIGQTLRLSPAANTGKSAAQSYQVQKGDSLSVIAKRFNVAVNDLLRLNRLKSSALKPGQQLTLRAP